MCLDICVYVCEYIPQESSYELKLKRENRCSR